jgi:hypothetical protein
MKMQMERMERRNRMPRMMRAAIKRKLLIWHPMRVVSVSGASGVSAIVNRAGYVLVSGLTCFDV